MGKSANFMIVANNKEKIVLTDLGPWSVYLTITNDAEGVVERFLPVLNGRRLFYYDSEGELTELLIKDGKFAGFKEVK